MPKRITASNAKPSKDHSKKKNCVCGGHSTSAKKPKRKDHHVHQSTG